MDPCDRASAQKLRKIRREIASWCRQSCLHVDVGMKADEGISQTGLSASPTPVCEDDWLRPTSEFARAKELLAEVRVYTDMTKRSLLLAAGLVSAFWCGSAEAQQFGDRVKAGFFGRSIGAAPAMSLGDSRVFPFGNAFAWMTAPNDFLPDWQPAEWQNAAYLNEAGTARQLRRDRTAASVANSVNDSSKEVAQVELRKSNLLENLHGEVGFLFGRSSGGRVNYDVESGYIFGTTGDENVQISVGAFYEHASADFPRRGR